jgi:hypothetical protein
MYGLSCQCPWQAPGASVHGRLGLLVKASLLVVQGQPELSLRVHLVRAGYPQGRSSAVWMVLSES